MFFKDFLCLELTRYKFMRFINTQMAIMKDWNADARVYTNCLEIVE